MTTTRERIQHILASKTASDPVARIQNVMASRAASQ